jgi:polyisoprenyl-teichoic acid--peptidoglycan teichoic acid transferase
MSNNPEPPDDLSDPPVRSGSRKNPLLKVLGWLAIAIIGLACFYIGFVFKHLNKASRGYIGPIINIHGDTVQKEFPGQSTINLLIIGRDYDYNNQDQVIKTNARADLLMMAKLDFVNNEVKILSIPRDTKAAIPGFPDSKINSAEEKGGPQLTEATVLQDYNIPTDHFVALDFPGFEKAINVLGGVDLTVDKKMDYDDNWGYLHIHLLPGYQHLNGNNAMGFVRFRHSDSDLIRTKRQQALLAALKIKLDQPLTFVVLPTLINIMNDSSATDLTDSQKIAIAMFLHGVPHDSIEMQTLPSIEGGYYVYTDWPKAAPVIKDWFGVNPPPGISLVSPTTIHRRRHHVSAAL